MGRLLVYSRVRVGREALSPRLGSPSDVYRYKSLYRYKSNKWNMFSKQHRFDSETSLLFDTSTCIDTGLSSGTFFTH